MFIICEASVAPMFIANTIANTIAWSMITTTVCLIKSKPNSNSTDHFQDLGSKVVKYRILVFHICIQVYAFSHLQHSNALICTQIHVFCVMITWMSQLWGYPSQTSHSNLLKKFKPFKAFKSGSGCWSERQHDSMVAGMGVITSISLSTFWPDGKLSWATYIAQYH
jgi:hypothetical protein